MSGGFFDLLSMIVLMPVLLLATWFWIWHKQFCSIKNGGSLATTHLFYATKKDGKNLAIRPFSVTHVGFFDCVYIIAQSIKSYQSITISKRHVLILNKSQPKLLKFAIVGSQLSADKPQTTNHKPNNQQLTTNNHIC